MLGLGRFGPALGGDGFGLLGRRERVALLSGQFSAGPRIAERLVISRATAKTHVARLFAKLGVRDRVDLAITAYDAGLVPRRR